MTKDELIGFISSRKLMVIATKGERYPESAVVEFGNDGLTLVFDANDKSRKYQNILKSPEVSVVIGLDEDVNKTVQYEGRAKLLNGNELEELKKIYFQKSPDAQKWEHKEGSVYFKVEPVWIRFTDLNTDPWDITIFNI